MRDTHDTDAVTDDQQWGSHDQSRTNPIRELPGALATTGLMDITSPPVAHSDEF